MKITANEIKEATALKKEVEALQEIQKTHKPTTSAWMEASELLAPLFARMAVLTHGNPF